ncbi:hypothetical protein BT96DRAFT_647096 [Gymnopus androsaceus JB14]|uniref:Uncharacterized protein n=1 Tax=Gymnopus androsaceus JB14 TaxID=1447944 RepID=A0A6A4HRV0_9AGAR|nr:hypothetical protein BT96DRAFT_647096 [Gymnopus androsaceus JB14]
MEGHTDEVNSVAFSPDGRRIVSGSSDHSVQVWDAESRQIVEYTHCVSLNYFPPLMTFCFHHNHSFKPPQGLFQKIYLDSQGWLHGSNSSILLWIPPEYQPTLVVPPLQLLISISGQTTLDLSNFVHGNDWVRCWEDDK